MAVVGRVDNFRTTFGGEPHSGWLPPGAATPLTTPIREVVLNFVIESEGSGYLLIVDSADGSVRADTWHESVAEAQAQAWYSYRVPPSAWSSCPATAE